MIVRMWHGRTAAEKADEYDRFLRQRAIPDYRGIEGNRFAALFRRDEGAITHFVTFTLWESLDAIRAFAGDDVTRARYYDEDPGFLLELEPEVVHYTLECADGSITFPPGNSRPAA